MAPTYHRIVINVGGMSYETYRETLARFPNTLLGSDKSLEKYYNALRGEYFFDRSRILFDAVLFYYQSWGILSCPKGVSEEDFLEEIAFFKIDARLRDTRGPDIEHAKKYIKGHTLPKSEGRIRGKIYDIMFSPSSSPLAGLIEVFSFLALASVVGLSCAETVPSVRAELANPAGWLHVFFVYTNAVCHVWFVVEYVTRMVSVRRCMQFVRSYDR